jgi:hypothetical protein
VNPYLLLAAYRLSIMTAETLAVVRLGNTVQLQMRGPHGDSFYSVELSKMKRS